MQRIDRRPFATALAVVLTGAVAGCGGSGGGARPAGTTSASAPAATPIALVLGISRAPGGGAVTAGALDRTVALLKRRLAGVGVTGALVERTGAGIDVTLPDRAAAARAKPVVTGVGRLVFYDWETSVVGADGRHHPRDEEVTGGMAAGAPGSGTVPAVEALRIAQRVPGAILVRAELDSAEPAAVKAARDAYFVLAGRRLLTGADLRDVAPDTDATTGQPDVVFRFSAAGRRAWRRATRVIARRGAALVTPGVAPQVVAQHFAVVLDDHIISVPYIDPQQNPDGIDASHGSQISAGFTRASARALATVLKTGPTPVTLTLVEERPR